MDRAAGQPGLSDLKPIQFLAGVLEQGAGTSWVGIVIRGSGAAMVLFS